MALTIDGSDPTGDLGDLLDAKLNLAGGKILQIVRATDSTNRSTTSTSFVDTDMTVTITPQKSTSAILLLCFVVVQIAGAAGGSRGDFRITDNSDNNVGPSVMRVGIEAASQGTADFVSFAGYATPATTSAVTFKLRFAAVNASTTVTCANSSLGISQFYAIEVSA